MNFKFYLISDRKLFSSEESFLNAVDTALKTGIKAFQLREKDMTTREFYFLAKKLREITRRNDALFFINDRVDVAMAVEADGVHLPQNGLPPDIVKKVWKDKFLIGVSTHSLKEAIESSEWADFITFGPVFYTPSKSQYGEPLGVETLKKVKSKVRCPVFAVGGIKHDNIKTVFSHCDGVALISGILAQSNIEEAVKQYLKILGE